MAHMYSGVLDRLQREGEDRRTLTIIGPDGVDEVDVNAFLFGILMWRREMRRNQLKRRRVRQKCGHR